MVAVGQARICLVMLLPDGVQSGLLIEGCCQVSRTGKRWRIGRQIAFCHFGKKIGRVAQVQAERDVLRKVARGIMPHMLMIVLAHQVGGFAASIGIVRRLGHFAANLLAKRVRGVRFLVVSAGIDRGQDQ